VQFQKQPLKPTPTRLLPLTSSVTSALIRIKTTQTFRLQVSFALRAFLSLFPANILNLANKKVHVPQMWTLVYPASAGYTFRIVKNAIK
jgi:hypothetical protein